MSETHFADRLFKAFNAKGGPVCVGLDPVFEKLPDALRQGRNSKRATEVASAFVEFCEGVMDAVLPVCGCVKIQSACFERYLWPGVEAYRQVLAAAHDRGLIVIGDAKRGDIGTSSAHYAFGCLADADFEDLGSCPGPDALTVNGYLGMEGIAPIINLARDQNKGVFVLVRTSNPGGDDVQQPVLASGDTVAQNVAGLVHHAGHTMEMVGSSGYSLVGAVVGATKHEEIDDLRSRMPRAIFLVPGYGAQGGGAEDVKPCFNRDGRGAIITASRSVIYAYQNAPAGDWQSAVGDAASRMRDEIAGLF